MKRNYFRIHFITTLLTAIILGLFLPWWSIMLAAFITGFIFGLKKLAVFFASFIAIFVYWSAYAFYTASQNDFILSKKVSNLFELGDSPYLLILLTGIIGGLAAGIAGMFGKQCRLLLKTNL